MHMEESKDDSGRLLSVEELRERLDVLVEDFQIAGIKSKAKSQAQSDRRSNRGGKASVGLESLDHDRDSESDAVDDGTCDEAARESMPESMPESSMPEVPLASESSSTSPAPSSTSAPALAPAEVAARFVLAPVGALAHSKKNGAGKNGTGAFYRAMYDKVGKSVLGRLRRGLDATAIYCVDALEDDVSRALWGRPGRRGVLPKLLRQLLVDGFTVEVLVQGQHWVGIATEEQAQKSWEAVRAHNNTGSRCRLHGVRATAPSHADGDGAGAGAPTSASRAFFLETMSVHKRGVLSETAHWAQALGTCLDEAGDFYSSAEDTETLLTRSFLPLRGSLIVLPGQNWLPRAMRMVRLAIARTWAAQETSAPDHLVDVTVAVAVGNRAQEEADEVALATRRQQDKQHQQEQEQQEQQQQQLQQQQQGQDGQQQQVAQKAPAQPEEDDEIESKEGSAVASALALRSSLEATAAKLYDEKAAAAELLRLLVQERRRSEDLTAQLSARPPQVEKAEAEADFAPELDPKVDQNKNSAARMSASTSPSAPEAKQVHTVAMTAVGTEAETESAATGPPSCAELRTHEFETLRLKAQLRQLQRTNQTQRESVLELKRELSVQNAQAAHDSREAAKRNAACGEVDLEVEVEVEATYRVPADATAEAALAEAERELVDVHGALRASVPKRVLASHVRRAEAALLRAEHDVAVSRACAGVAALQAAPQAEAAASAERSAEDLRRLLRNKDAVVASFVDQLERVKAAGKAEADEHKRRAEDAERALQAGRTEAAAREEMLVDTQRMLEDAEACMRFYMAQAIPGASAPPAATSSAGFGAMGRQGEDLFNYGALMVTVDEPGGRQRGSSKRGGARSPGRSPASSQSSVASLATLRSGRSAAGPFLSAAHSPRSPRSPGLGPGEGSGDTPHTPVSGASAATLSSASGVSGVSGASGAGRRRRHSSSGKMSKVVEERETPQRAQEAMLRLARKDLAAAHRDAARARFRLESRLCATECSRRALERMHSLESETMLAEALSLKQQLCAAKERVLFAVGHQHQAQQEAARQMRQKEKDLGQACAAMDALRSKMDALFAQDVAANTAEQDKVREELRLAKEKIQLLQLRHEQQRIANSAAAATEAQVCKVHTQTTQCRQTVLDAGAQTEAEAEAEVEAKAALTTTTTPVPAMEFWEIAPTVRGTTRARVERILEDLRVTLSSLRPYLAKP